MLVRTTRRAATATTATALHALNRLGWGPRPGDLDRAGDWPEQVQPQLQRERLPPLPNGLADAARRRALVLRADARVQFGATKHRPAALIART